MKIEIQAKTAELTTNTIFEQIRKTVEENKKYRHQIDSTIMVEMEKLTIEDLTDLQEAATNAKDSQTKNAIKAVLAYNNGKIVKIPNFKSAPYLILRHLTANKIKGWIFKKDKNGLLYPELVKQLQIYASRNKNDRPTLAIQTEYVAFKLENNRSERTSIQTHSFDASDLTKKTVEEALFQKRLFVETKELHDEYQNQIERHIDLVEGEFAEQFILTGIPIKENNTYHTPNKMENCKVIHDTQSNMSPTNFAESQVLKEELGEIPFHPIIQVFDLKKHVFYETHSGLLTPYKYKPELEEKLILPTSHKNMLQILTGDINLFVDDIIEGKGAGNVILCKGSFGVGKTLTAEIYSEIIKRPLYSIHSGTLGTNAADIDENLKEVFERAERWNAVLLIDEADVFVMRRNDNIEQNAVVAVFLRTLEYFKGLLFMTTNRGNDIDEAILSRCAAIIHYNEKTSPENMRKIWEVMAESNKKTIPKETLDKLVEVYGHISPRDVKMLLRLALRVAHQRKEEFPEMKTFRECAMFRGISEQAN